jgi:hypothetical protein
MYVRWGADRSPFALEFRLDLVGQIRDAIAAAESSGIEIGGVLVGSLPTAYSSTIRIEDVEMIPRSPQDGQTFMLDPGQHDRFSEVRWRLREDNKVAVGLFRSHRRSGGLGPSLADRTLLSSEFSGPVYVLLLVQASEPHAAAFFIASHGQLPVEASIRSAHFDEADFRALPEIDPEMPARAPAPPPRRPQRWGVGAAVAIAAALSVGALFLFTDANRILTGFSSLLGNPHRLELEARPAGEEILVTWNHSCRDLDDAQGAVLTIRTPETERKIKLGLDEVRLGAVELAAPSKTGEVTFTVMASGGASPVTQTALWARP